MIFAPTATTRAAVVVFVGLDRAAEVCKMRAAAAAV